MEYRKLDFKEIRTKKIPVKVRFKKKDGSYVYLKGMKIVKEEVK